MDAIVEDKDGIAVEAICSVEAICGSDTMKKQMSFTKMIVQIFDSSTKIRERKVARKRKKVRENKEKNRERIEKLREEKLNCSLLNESKYNTSHFYIKELHE